MSPKIVEHMTWHHPYDTVDGVMVHIFYSEAHKRFNGASSVFIGI